MRRIGQVDILLGQGCILLAPKAIETVNGLNLLCSIFVTGFLLEGAHLTVKCQEQKFSELVHDICHIKLHKQEDYILPRDKLPTTH